MNPSIQATAQFVAWCRGLAYQRHVIIRGVRCHVSAARAPSPRPPRPPRPPSSPSSKGQQASGSDRCRCSDVLFYVHGGAFVATLHAADMGVLTDWALRTGAVIIFPECKFSLRE